MIEFGGYTTIKVMFFPLDLKLYQMKRRRRPFVRKTQGWLLRQILRAKFLLEHQNTWAIIRAPTVRYILLLHRFLSEAGTQALLWEMTTTVSCDAGPMKDVECKGLMRPRHILITRRSYAEIGKVDTAAPVCAVPVRMASLSSAPNV